MPRERLAKRDHRSELESDGVPFHAVCCEQSLGLGPYLRLRAAGGRPHPHRVAQRRSASEAGSTFRTTQLVTVATLRGVNTGPMQTYMAPIWPCISS